MNNLSSRYVSHRVAAMSPEHADSGFLADVRRIADDVFHRRFGTHSTITWQLLREVEDETLFDVNLMCQWPHEIAACMHGNRPTGSSEALHFGESARDVGLMVAASFALALADKAPN
jgi:hypothetical protein